METDQNRMTHGNGGWAVFSDFSGLFLKASAAGLVVSVVVGAVVLLVASFAG